jgi:hypothetical protein
VAYAVAPVWSRDIGLDVWNYPDAREQLRAAEEQRDEIVASQEELFRQIELGNHVAERLADGSMTLREAVAELEDPFGRREGFDVVWRDEYGTPTFRHGVARYVIGRVEALLAGDPARWAAVSARLEAEYDALGR